MAVNAYQSIVFKTKVSDGEADAGKYIEIQVDSEDNDGKSEFGFGDTVNFRVLTNVSGYSMDSTDGTVSPAKKGTEGPTEQITETISFSGNSASTTKKIKAGTFSYDIGSWVGFPKSLNVSLVAEAGESNVKTADESEINGSVEVSYTAISYYSHSLSGVNMPSDYDEEADEGYTVMVQAISNEAA